MEVLEEIIEAFPGFLTDDDVNGGDLVEFVGGMITRYEANRPRPAANPALVEAARNAEALNEETGP